MQGELKTVSPTPDEILACELKKLAVKTSGKETGAKLVSWVAQRMPSDAGRLEMRFEIDPEAILRAAVEILEEEGEIRSDVAHGSQYPTLSAVIGSGFLGLNPAVVTVEVIPDGKSAASVTIFGVAKEGIIKQRAGQKAARRIADLLAGRV